MKKLRILILNWRCIKHPQAGGAEKATFEIARRWVKWGHEVHLICGNFKGGQKQDEIDGIKVFRIGGKYSVYPKSIIHYYQSYYKKFDVVIEEINNIPFLTPLYVKEPIVLFLHQIGANMLFEELPYVQAKSWAMLEPSMLRMYRNRQIITSQSTKEDLLQMGIPEQNINVINYGVDHEIYTPCRAKSLFPQILFFGRLKKFKGVHFLIEAMKQVLVVVPNARLSIVGKGDEDYMNELKKLTAKLELEKSVVFHELGFSDSTIEKVQLMQEAWVMGFPSAREGFGLVVVEANACGTPTVSTNVPGLRDTVKDYETGILVPRNVESLAKSIILLLTDHELRVKMSKSAFDWSLQFNWDQTAKNMLKVVYEAIQSHQNRKIMRKITIEK